MDTFARVAFFTIARDAGVSALAAGILMVAYSFNPPLALVLGGSVAMFFAGVMLVRALVLTEDRIVATEPWQVIEPDQRPVGDVGRAVACERLEAMLLGAAKNAAGIASVMFGLGLLSSWAQHSLRPPAHRFVTDAGREILLSQFHLSLGATMEHMRRIAYETVLRACGFASLGIFCVMTGMSFNPKMAFQTGGFLTTVMAFVLVLKAREALTKDYRKTEMWLYIDKDFRPPEAYAQWASATVLRDTYLTFAMWTSLISIAMWVLALIFSLIGTTSTLAMDEPPRPQPAVTKSSRAAPDAMDHTTLSPHQGRPAPAIRYQVFD